MKDFSSLPISKKSIVQTPSANEDTLEKIADTVVESEPLIKRKKKEPESQ
jgi:hypothetical protein